MKKPEAVKEKNGLVGVQITPPDIRTAVFNIQGNAPLVIHRFSLKAKRIMLGKMILGSQAAKGKKREALNEKESFDGARYISTEGWDGFNVASIRAAMVHACRLVGFKMILTKMSIFVIADGRDKDEPQFGLIRIRGCQPVMQHDIGRVETGQAYVIIRPAYHDWSATLRIQYDADQFSVQDVAHLLMRVGTQVGLCEGRPGSKDSCGMGWGTFEVVNKPQLASKAA